MISHRLEQSWVRNNSSCIRPHCVGKFLWLESIEDIKSYHMIMICHLLEQSWMMEKSFCESPHCVGKILFTRLQQFDHPLLQIVEDLAFLLSHIEFSPTPCCLRCGMIKQVTSIGTYLIRALDQSILMRTLHLINVSHRSNQVCPLICSPSSVSCHYSIRDYSAYQQYLLLLQVAYSQNGSVFTAYSLDFSIVKSYLRALYA